MFNFQWMFQLDSLLSLILYSPQMQNVFVQMVKCIYTDGKMYLSQLLNVFL